MAGIPRVDQLAEPCKALRQPVPGVGSAKKHRVSRELPQLRRRQVSTESSELRAKSSPLTSLYNPLLRLVNPPLSARYAREGSYRPDSGFSIFCGRSGRRVFCSGLTKSD